MLENFSVFFPCVGVALAALTCPFWMMRRRNG